jgi:hypothetical protein
MSDICYLDMSCTWITILWCIASNFKYLDTTLCDKVCQWLATGHWLSQGTLVSSANKTDRYDITEILLKVVLNTTTLTLNI